MSVKELEEYPIKAVLPLLNDDALERTIVAMDLYTDDFNRVKKIRPKINHSMLTVFEVMVKIYANQLIRHTENQQKNSTNRIAVTIPKLNCTVQDIKEFKGENIFSNFFSTATSLSIATIANCRKRLNSLGVIINYEKGYKSGASFHINPEFITIYDDATQKLIFTENNLAKDINYEQ